MGAPPPGRAHQVLIRLPNTAPFIGAGVSILLGIVVTLLTDEKALLGLCVGLLGTVIAFQVDALARFERRADREDRLADREDRLAKILTDTEGEDWVVASFDTISDAVRIIHGNDLFTRSANRKLSATARFFRRAGLGEIDSAVNFEDLVTLVNGTSTSIRANTLSRSERAFWRAEGKAYWDANVAALGRKVKIQRVFVYATEDDSEFDHVSAMQSAVGVQVRRVREDQLDSDLVEHILILDGLWSQEIKLGRGDRAEKYIYRVDPSEIDAAADKFARIWAVAAELSRDAAVAELEAAGKPVPRRVRAS